MLHYRQHGGYGLTEECDGNTDGEETMALRDLDSGFSSGTVSFVTLAKFLHLTLLTYKMGRIKSAFCTSQGYNRGTK